MEKAGFDDVPHVAIAYRGAGEEPAKARNEIGSLIMDFGNTGSASSGLMMASGSMSCSRLRHQSTRRS